MILGISDIIMMIIASYLALLTRFEFYPSQIAPIFLKNAAKYMPLNLFCSIVIFMAYRLYSTQWKYAGISDFINVVKAVVIAAAFQLIGIYMLQWEIPRSYYFLYLVYLLLGMFFIRLLVRLIQGSEPLKVNDIGKKKVPVMLIGAGEAGSIILNEIKKSTYVTKTIRCIIDDDPAKKGTYLSGIPVVGNRNTILRNAVKFDVEEIILAIPTIEPKDRKDILEICKQTGCRLSILPGLYQLINSEVTVSALREVEIEDLLGREPVKANLPSIMSYVKDRVVFVTGGGGSIGSEICRQIAGGGMIASENEEYIKHATFLATQAKEPVRHYEHKEIGYNYRMSNITAGVGRGQLLHLDEHIAKKKAIYETYKDAFKDYKQVHMNPYETCSEPNFWLSCMTIDEDSKTKPLDIIEALERENIESRPIWKPLHQQPVFKGCEFYSHYEDDKKPVSEDIFDCGLCLPSDIKNTKEDMDRIIGIIRSVLDR